MAVYTKINKKDISYINKKFENQKFLSFKGIKQGIENTNYLLKSKNNKFILIKNLDLKDLLVLRVLNKELKIQIIF